MSSVITARDFEYFFSNISPCFESDESFFDAVRAMTGLSSQKPSVQIQRMRTGDTKRVSDEMSYTFAGSNVHWYWYAGAIGEAIIWRCHRLGAGSFVSGVHNCIDESTEKGAISCLR